MKRVPQIVLEDLEEEDEDIATPLQSARLLEPQPESPKTEYVTTFQNRRFPAQYNFDLSDPSQSDVLSTINEVSPNPSPTPSSRRRSEFSTPKIDEVDMQKMMQIATLSTGQSRFGNTYKYLNKASMAEYTATKWDVKTISVEVLIGVCSQLDHFYTLRHKHIARFFGYHVSDAEIVLLRCFMPSGTVADKLKKGPLTEAQALKYFKQLMIALDYLHSKSLVHGNIKASNMLVTLSDDIQLADMTISHNPSPDVHRRRTLLLAAPEMLKDRDSLHRTSFATDIWASGCCLVAMVTRFAPYKDQFITLSMDQLHKRLLAAHDGSQPLTYRSETLLPTASEQLAALVDSCLEIEPKLRLCANELLAEMGHGRRTSSARSSRTTTTSTPGPVKIVIEDKKMNHDDLYNDGPMEVVENVESSNDESEKMSISSDVDAMDCIRWYVSRFLIFGILFLKWIGMVFLAALSLAAVAGTVFLAIFVIYKGIGVVIGKDLNEGFIVLIALIMLPILILLTTLCCNSACEKYKQHEEDKTMEKSRFVRRRPSEDILLCGYIVVHGSRKKEEEIRRKMGSVAEKKVNAIENKRGIANDISRLA